MAFVEVSTSLPPPPKPTLGDLLDRGQAHLDELKKKYEDGYLTLHFALRACVHALGASGLGDYARPGCAVDMVPQGGIRFWHPSADPKPHPSTIDRSLREWMFAFPFSFGGEDLAATFKVRAPEDSFFDNEGLQPHLHRDDCRCCPACARAARGKASALA